jgi:hypothetical protein
MHKTIIALALCAGLGGCLSTQTMPLAPNMVRIDTQAGGLLFTGQTVPATMKAAANATLQAGYTHFRLSNASMGQGSSDVSAFCSGGDHFASCNTVSAPTSGAAVTVTMMNANDPGAAGAFNARQVLSQYQ